MKKFLVAGIAAAAFCGAPAIAADMPVKVPPMAPAAYDPWTGCYVGANIGGAWANTTFTEGTPSFFNAAGTQEHPRPSGFVGGGQIGCDRQFASNWVIGLQGMWDWAG